MENINIPKNVIEDSLSINEALVRLDNLGDLPRILVILNSGKVVGTLTDGDIRRGLIRGVGTSELVSIVMNKKPLLYREGYDSLDKLKTVARNQLIDFVPVVGREGEFIRFLNCKLEEPILRKENRVLILAGGKGQRLYPLTKDCPKPMLTVNSKPVLERILESFINQGFYKFYFSVNYLKQIIMDHFGDGRDWGVSIEYLEEEIPLGTGGPISLLPKTSSQEPIIITNGDVLQDVNYLEFLNYHEESKSLITLGVKNFNYQIPYGVVRVDKKGNLKQIYEKPTENHLINTGLYACSPEVLSLVPKDQYFEITSLISTTIKNKEKVIPYILNGYWTDIGKKEDFLNAHEYHEKKEDFSNVD